MPAADLPGIQAAVVAAGQGGVLKPLVSLDTPGKATVQVVILADPDGYEICYVGDEVRRHSHICGLDAQTKCRLFAHMWAGCARLR